MVEETSTAILRVGQDVLGMPTGRRTPGVKETWCWNDNVQEVIKANKVAENIWEASRRQEDKYRYRQANNAAKKAVATTKALAMNALYEELETPEGERKVILFRIAKVSTPPASWRRPKGRPPLRWADQIVRDTHMTLSDAMTATHDRPSWRSLVRDATRPATQAN